MPEFLCAFDIGTSCVKGGIFSPDGRLVAARSKEYRVIQPKPSWAEQSIQEMWQNQCEVSLELINQSGIDPNDIAAVAVSSQRATFVPLDNHGDPLMNFIGWQDKRSIKQCQDIERQVGIQKYYQISGLPIEPTASVSKMLWLKENRPDLFDRTAQFASTQNVHLRQLGIENPPCDLPNAAYMGLLDVDKLEWSKLLLDQLGIPIEKMPPLSPSGKVVGAVSKEASSATGLAAGTPVVTAGGDLQCAGVGVGVTEPGVVGVGIGSGADVVIFLDEPIRHPDLALNCLPHAMSGAWEMEGLCLASGAAYKWFRDNFAAQEKETASASGLDTYTILNQAAEAAPPGSNGMIFLPTLIGAGAPHWNPMASGIVIGLTLSTDKKDFARAIMEGVCFEIRWILEAVEMLGRTHDKLHIYGGAAKSRLWNQIAADIYGFPVCRPEVEEAGLVGAAICAGVGTGIFKNARAGARSMIRIVEEYAPRPNLHVLYSEIFEVYKKTYQTFSNAGIFERLASISDQSQRL